MGHPKIPWAGDRKKREALKARSDGLCLRAVTKVHLRSHQSLRLRNGGTQQFTLWDTQAVKCLENVSKGTWGRVKAQPFQGTKYILRDRQDPCTSLWGAIHASPVGHPGERGWWGETRGLLWKLCQGCLTTAGQKRVWRVTFQGRQRLQARLRREWPREKSPALILQFLKQSLSGHGCRRPPALPEPANCTRWKRSEYLHAIVMDTTPGHSLFWKTSGEACRKTSLPLLRSSYLLSLLG